MGAGRALVPSCVWQSSFVVGGLLAVSLQGSAAWAGAAVSSFSGVVQVHSQGWEEVDKAPYPVDPGQTVRTAAHATAVVTFADGSRVEMAGNTSFTLKEAEPSSYSMSLTFGRLKAFVEKISSRRFEVRTPTAVAAVRGTEFQVEVLGDGTTNIDLYKGLLAVDDKHGRQILLHPNESTRVNTLGMRAAARTSTAREAARERFRNSMRREMAFDETRRQIQANAVRELRLADYQQGKTVINAFGQTVRVEEYIVRPTPNQFDLVVLNEGKASGFSYFSYLGTFNTTLPTDLSQALSQLSGTVGVAPTYFLTAFQSTRSNGTDSMIEIANGGHPVNVNNNPSADPAEAVTTYFNPATSSFASLAPGTAFYKTLFDNDGFYIDGVLKSGWNGANIQTYNSGFGAYSPTAATTNDPITNAVLANPLPVFSNTSQTMPNPNQISQDIRTTYSDGTFFELDNYIVDNLGKIASPAEFSAATTGTSFVQGLLNFNYEQVITASEFGGRKIDLVVAPKIFVQSGLIQ